MELTHIQFVTVALGLVATLIALITAIIQFKRAKLEARKDQPPTLDRARWWKRTAFAALAVLILGLAGLAAVTWWKHAEANRVAAGQAIVPTTTVAPEPPMLAPPPTSPRQQVGGGSEQTAPCFGSGPQFSRTHSLFERQLFLFPDYSDMWIENDSTRYSFRVECGRVTAKDESGRVLRDCVDGQWTSSKAGRVHYSGCGGKAILFVRQLDRPF